MLSNRCRIKKDDKVRVITGKDRGKIGKILRIIYKNNTAVVEKVNLMKKHTKPTEQNRQGGIIEFEAPIHSSNLKLMCDKCIEPVRPRIKILDDGSKVRVCRKCNEVIEG